jgi:hypothetical protein
VPTLGQPYQPNDWVAHDLIFFSSIYIYLILCFKEKLCWKKITKVIEGVIRKNHC